MRVVTGNTGILSELLLLSLIFLALAPLQVYGQGAIVSTALKKGNTWVRSNWSEDALFKKCPSQCQIQGGVVLYCHSSHLLDMESLAACVERLNFPLVVDLRSKKPQCTCSLLDFIRMTSSFKIVTFTQISCGLFLLENCSRWLPERVRSIRHCGFVAGLVMEQDDPRWRQATRRHLTRLWAQVNSIPFTGLRERYRQMVVDIVEAEYWSHTRRSIRRSGSKDRILPFRVYKDGYITRLYDEKDGWHHVDDFRIIWKDYIGKKEWHRLVNPSGYSELAVSPFANKPVANNKKTESKIISKGKKTESKIISKGKKTESKVIPKGKPKTFSSFESPSEVKLIEDEARERNRRIRLIIILGIIFLTLVFIIVGFFVMMCRRAKSDNQYLATSDKDSESKKKKSDRSFLQKLTRHSDFKDKQYRPQSERIEQPSFETSSLPGKVVPSRVQTVNTDMPGKHDAMQIDDKKIPLRPTFGSPQDADKWKESSDKTEEASGEEGLSKKKKKDKKGKKGGTETDTAETDMDAKDSAADTGEGKKKKKQKKDKDAGAMEPAAEATEPVMAGEAGEGGEEGEAGDDGKKKKKKKKNKEKGDSDVPGSDTAMPAEGGADTEDKPKKKKKKKNEEDVPSETGEPAEGGADTEDKPKKKKKKKNEGDVPTETGEPTAGEEDQSKKKKKKKKNEEDVPSETGEPTAGEEDQSKKKKKKKKKGEDASDSNVSSNSPFLWGRDVTSNSPTSFGPAVHDYVPHQRFSRTPVSVDDEKSVELDDRRLTNQDKVTDVPTEFLSLHQRLFSTQNVGGKGEHLTKSPLLTSQARENKRKLAGEGELISTAPLSTFFVQEERCLLKTAFQTVRTDKELPFFKSQTQATKPVIDNKTIHGDSLALVTQKPSHISHSKESFTSSSPNRSSRDATPDTRTLVPLRPLDEERRGMVSPKQEAKAIFPGFYNWKEPRTLKPKPLRPLPPFAQITKVPLQPVRVNTPGLHFPGERKETAFQTVESRREQATQVLTALLKKQSLSMPFGTKKPSPEDDKQQATKGTGLQKTYSSQFDTIRKREYDSVNIEDKTSTIFVDKVKQEIVEERPSFKVKDIRAQPDLEMGVSKVHPSRDRSPRLVLPEQKDANRNRERTFDQSGYGTESSSGVTSVKLILSGLVPRSPNWTPKSVSMRNTASTGDEVRQQSAPHYPKSDQTRESWSTARFNKNWLEQRKQKGESGDRRTPSKTRVSWCLPPLDAEGPDLSSVLPESPDTLRSSSSTSMASSSISPNMVFRSTPTDNQSEDQTHEFLKAINYSFTSTFEEVERELEFLKTKEGQSRLFSNTQRILPADNLTTTIPSSDSFVLEEYFPSEAFTESESGSPRALSSREISSLENSFNRTSAKSTQASATVSGDNATVLPISQTAPAVSSKDALAYKSVSNISSSDNKCVFQVHVSQSQEQNDDDKSDEFFNASDSLSRQTSFISAFGTFDTNVCSELDIRTSDDDLISFYSEDSKTSSSKFWSEPSKSQISSKSTSWESAKSKQFKGKNK